MKKKTLVFLVVFLAGCALALALAYPALAIPRDLLDDIAIVAVMEPLNKTTVPGHIDFPYFPEKMGQMLSEANYRVIPITQKMLADEGIKLYSSIGPDRSLTAAEVSLLAKKLRFDALVTGNIYELQVRTERQFLFMKKFYDFTMEGQLYYKDGRELWHGRIRKYDREIRSDDSREIEKRKVFTNILTSQEIGDSLLAELGRKPDDRDPPEIAISSPSKVQVLKSTTIILKGEVADNSKVWQLSVNGRDMQIVPHKRIEFSYPIRLEEKRAGERETIQVTARDIFENSASVEVPLVWGKTLNAYVKEIKGSDILINKGRYQGVENGMAFTVHSVEKFNDPLSGVPMYNVRELGAVVVTNVYDNTSAATFLSSELAGRVKKGDILK
ncbi:MAG: hypothetical protein V2A78_03340 [bacterium]